MNEKMDWPSERVAQGGIFHPRKVNYSKDTHDLIKLLMEEQRLTMSQRNKVNYHLRNGDPLPPSRQPKRERQHDYEEQLAFEIMLRAKNSRKRTLGVIKASGAFETQKYVPIHHLREPSDQQKIRLQERMSGIKHHPEVESLSVKARHKHKRTASRKTVPEDLLVELMNEVYERADWLAEMEELGEGKAHRDVIHGQIAERLRKVKHLEKQRQLEQGALQLNGEPTKI